MMPQGQLVYYTHCQTPPVQFSHHPHVPYLQSAPPASFEPPPFARPAITFVDAPTLVSPACGQPISAHHLHGNFAHFSGSEHASSVSLSMEGSQPCTWQGQSSTCSASPPPPAYPPGFEPKRDTTSCATMTAPTGDTIIVNAHLPHLQPQAQQQPQPHLQSYNACSQPGSQSQPHFYPHSHSHVLVHSQVNSHAESHAHFDLQQQHHHHKHQFLTMQPPPLQQHQHQSSQMAYPALQMACQTPMPHLAAQILHSSVNRNYDANGAVLGVPVMGTPVFLDANNLAPSTEILHPPLPVQNLYSELSYPRQQSCKSIYHLTKYFQRGVSNFENQTDEVRQKQRGWQPPIRQTNRIVFNGKYSRANMGRNFVPSCSKPSFTKPDQKQLTHTQRQRDPFHDPRSCAEEKPNHSQSIQIPIVTAERANNSCMPNSSGEEVDKILDKMSLKFNPPKTSPLALACCEAQPSSLLKLKEEGLEFEMPGETDTECKLGYADSTTPARQFTKNKAGITWWLEQRKTKYPTPANMQRKAEERRKQEEMGEFICKKPRHDLRHFHGALSASYCRREDRRTDKQTDFHEHCIGKSHMGKLDSKGHTRNDGIDPDHCENALEMPMEIEDSGPMESPYRGQNCDFEKVIEEEDLQSTLKSGVITGQNGEEKIRAPCFAFVFRRKRQEQKRGQSALVAQRQKRQLFQLLDRDLEKENIHLLHCCRYIVNNEFFQDVHLKIPSHLSFVGVETLPDVNNSHAEEMDTAETPLIASVKKPASDLSADNHFVENNQHSPNWEEQVVVLKGADNCQFASRSTSADGKQSCSVKSLAREAHCSAELLGQEMGCCSKQHELMEDAHGPTMSAEKFYGQEAFHSGVLTSQASDLSNKCKEQTEEAHQSTMLREEMKSGYMEQDQLGDELFTMSSIQCCHKNDGDEVQPVPATTSHNQSAVGGFVDSAESCLLVDPSLTRLGKEAIFPWRHVDSYHLKNMEGGLAPSHYDCLKAPLIASVMDTDTKQLDCQVPVSSLWDQPNSGLYVPGHNMDTSELGTGYCDSFLGDDDDILQYMNFDAFETDSGMCYG
ncbi:hypothetical protein L7F22_005360 [Adiantum nelumboides]|nr:hypothetical protein [Adiantum nelumboides]